MSELEDYAWLTGPTAAEVLVELAADDAPLLRQLDRLRKGLGAERARLVVKQAGLRRRAAAKFGARAAQMFFTDVALQQATDRWIARYKAERFPREDRMFDFCSGIGGDLVSLAERGVAIGVEKLPGLALLATANLRVCGCAGTVRIGDVGEELPAEGELWHLDPDRRVKGRRSTHLEWHSPSLEVIERLVQAAPHGALKLAPAADVPQSWQDRTKLEWISRDRECRQLVVWFGSLAGTPGQRRATVITTPYDENAPSTACSFAGAADMFPPLASSLGAYVYDSDPAVRAAGLTGALAHALELGALSPGAGYLTADRPVEDPLVTRFRVREELPLREKMLAKHLREKGIGRLEIKKRGVDTDAEKLRRRLKLRGEDSATLFLTRQGTREIAILAERCE